MANYSQLKDQGMGVDGKGNYVQPYEGSNAWAGVGIAGLGVAGLEGYYNIQAAEASADASRYSAERLRTAGEAAVREAKLNNARLHESYNDTQANNMLVQSVQGRSGATLENLAKQAADDLAWDQKFMELSGIVTKAGYDMDAAAQDIAAAQSVRTGYQQAGLGMLGAGVTMGRLA